MMRHPLIYAAVAGALITLHQPGHEVYVNPEEIMLIMVPSKGTAAPWAKSEVVVHDRSLWVLETPREVKRLRDADN